MSEINLSDYRHSIDINVRFMDIDALQHVNNARYLNFLEEARIAYSQELLGIFNTIKELNVLVARVEIDFMRPILYGEKVKIHTRISRMGNKSFVFDSVIVSSKNGVDTVNAHALQTLVAFDVKTSRTIAIPEKLRSDILEIEPQIES